MRLCFYKFVKALSQPRLGDAGQQRHAAHGQHNEGVALLERVLRLRLPRECTRIILLPCWGKLVQTLPLIPVKNQREGGAYFFLFLADSDRQEPRKPVYGPLNLRLSSEP